MTNISRQEKGAPASRGGEFKALARAESTTALERPRHMLGVDSEWKNGGQASGVSVVESPVSDRAHNYAINFDTAGGHVHVNPFAFGIAHPYDEDMFEADRLYIGVDAEKPDTLQVQYAMAIDADYFDGVFAEQSDEQMAALEVEVLAAVRERIGDDTVTMEFSTGGERWDDVSVHYNREFGPENPEATIEPDGRLSVFTSNLMATLEDDQRYVDIRNGHGMAAVFDTLNKHGLKF